MRRQGNGMLLALAYLGLAGACADGPAADVSVVVLTAEQSSAWLYFTCPAFEPCDVEVQVEGTAYDEGGDEIAGNVVDVYLHEEVNFGGGINAYREVDAGSAPRGGSLSLHAQSPHGVTFFIEFNNPASSGNWSSAVAELRTRPVMPVLETIGPNRDDP